MLGAGIILMVKLLMPFVLLILAISAALKALRGYENKSKKKLEQERKKTARLQRTIEEQTVRLEQLDERNNDAK